MFKISNYIAYNGLMVYGTQPGTSTIGKILGESLWIDSTVNDAVGKWSETEGKWAVDLLRKLLDSGLEDPDIFFITPFRIVSHKLREMIRSDRSIADRLPGKTWEWAWNRVGTVHTFQGKEADTVVIVLGAPADFSAGARNWAGQPPNLLNVAVTRAKRRVYVIGNRNAWEKAGAFSHLAQLLPVMGKPKPANVKLTPRTRHAEPPRMPSVAQTSEPRQAGNQTVHAREHKYEIGRCSSCGAPAIPGDNVCYQCKG